MPTKQANPWSVKGIETDTRETAKEAARRAGMTVGQWLNAVIQQSASELGDAREKVRQSRKGQRDDRESVLDNQIEDLESRLGQMAQHLRSVQSLSMLQPSLDDRGPHVPQDPQSRVIDRLENDVFELAEAVSTLTQRFDRSENEARSAWSAIESRLGSIDEKFDRFADWGGRTEEANTGPEPVAKGAGHPGAASFVTGELEQAVEGIETGHLPSLPPDFETQRLMLEQIETMRRRLDDYDRKPAPDQLPSASTTALTSTLDKLADRLDSLQHHLANPPAMPPEHDAALAAIETKIERMQDSVHAAVSTFDTDRLFDRIATTQTEALAGPAAEFANLRNALDEITARQASIQETVNHAPLGRDLEHYFNTIADRLDQVLSSRSPDMEEIRTTIAELTRIMTEFARTPRADIDRLTDRFATLESRVAETLARRDDVGPEILKRLDDIGARAGAPDPRIDHMQKRLDEVADKIGRGVTAKVPELDRLSAQIDRIGEELDAARNGPSASGLELEQLDNRLRMIAERIDTATTSSRAGEHMFATMNAKLDALGDRMDASIPGQAVVADTTLIEERLNALGERIERSLSRPVQMPEAASIEAKLNSIGEQINRSLSQPQGGSTGTAAIEARLESIGDRIEKSARDAVRSAPAGGPDLSELEARLKAISERLEAPAPATGVAGISVDQLEQRLTSMTAEIQAAVTESRPDTAAIEARISDLVDQLGRAGNDEDSGAAFSTIQGQLRDLTERVDGLRGGDSAGLDHVAHQMSALGRRIDETHAQLQSFNAIESQLQGLVDKLGSAQSAAVEAAREAARAAMSEASQSGLADGPVLDALQARIADIRSATDATDRRTQETLESVHQTLQQVVERMQALETAPVSDQTGPQERPAPRPDTDSAQPAPIVAQDSPASSLEVQEPLRATPAARARSWAIPAESETADAPAIEEPTTEPDRKRRFELPRFRSRKSKKDEGVQPETVPDEVGRGQAAAETVSPPQVTAETPGQTSTPRARIRSSAKSGGSAMPRTEGGQPDFIAAARRAAQAAAESSVLQAKLDEAAESSGSWKKRLTALKKPLMFGGIAVILAIGSLALFRLVGPGDVGDATRAGLTDTVPPVTTPAEEADVVAAPAVGDGDAMRPVREIALGSTGESTLPPIEDTPIESPSPVSRVGEESEAVDVAARPVAPPIVDTVPVASVDSASTPEEPAEALPAQPSSDPDALFNSLPASRFPEAQRRAAADGDPVAQFAVAASFAESDTMSSDIFRAAEWYARAAGQGLAPAQYRLGSLYEKGQGVERDLEMAKIWYERGALAGNVKAMHNLAVVLAGADAGEPDYENAARWFMEAAQYGLADSQYNLGILYARGLGVDANLAESFKFFSLAADQGDTDAANKRDQLAEQLDDGTKIAARLAIQSWQPKPLDPAANSVDTTTFGTQPAGAAVDATEGLSGPDMVTQAQRLLNAGGFDVGVPDGIAGPRTVEAIRAFERDAGLPETGTITPDLVRQLTAAAG